MTTKPLPSGSFTMYQLDRASAYACPTCGAKGRNGMTSYDGVKRRNYGRMEFVCGHTAVKPLKVQRRKGVV